LTLIKDHRPYCVKKIYTRFQEFYVNHFIRPQLASLGQGFTFVKPWHIEFFGRPIIIGDFVNILSSSDHKVRISIWSDRQDGGRIIIGDYCLICPGVRIGSAAEVIIGDNSMLASGVYITDSDWHDLYNRIAMGKSAPVHIEENVWIGDSAIVCKGVTIGQNSIIGAGAVVVEDVPPNVIAAGNPARVVKHLAPEVQITTRAKWFADPDRLSGEIDRLDRLMLQDNSFLHWLRHLFFPAQGD